VAQPDINNIIDKLRLIICTWFIIRFFCRKNSLQLTEEQRNIVTHYQGAAIVYAVAGAGKSTTMAYRVQHLVNAWC
jgi:Tfp pilus assembly ATPase PilU